MTMYCNTADQYRYVRYIFTVDTYAAVFLKLDGVPYSKKPFKGEMCNKREFVVLPFSADKMRDLFYILGYIWKFPNP